MEIIMKILFTGLATVAACLSLNMLPTLAATITYSGDTTSGPTFNRPVAATVPPTTLSAIGTAVAYNVFTFSVDLSGTYSFTSLSTQFDLNDYDNELFLYQGSFSPLSPLTNVLIGNDDIGPGFDLSGFDFTLTAGTTYFVVTTGFDNGDFGSYFNTITGPGNFNNEIPEPSPALATLAFALMGIGLGVHRRLRS